MSGLLYLSVLILTGATLFFLSVVAGSSSPVMFSILGTIFLLQAANCIRGATSGVIRVLNPGLSYFCAWDEIRAAEHPREFRRQLFLSAVGAFVVGAILSALLSST